MLRTLALLFILVAGGVTAFFVFHHPPMRLMPPPLLYQTDGQRIMAMLEPVVVAAAEAGIARPLDRLGSATPMADWASAAHETLYARLFRS